MDIIDKVTYDFEWDNERDLSEETRKAFVNLFDPTNNDALLVVKFLTNICKWQDMAEYNDPVIEASPVNGNGGVDMPVNAEPSPEYDPENDPENAELLLPNVNIAIF